MSYDTTSATYNAISKYKGFDATQYATLMELANTNRVSQSAVQKSLLEALEAGKSFDDAIKQVTKNIPTLPPPSVSEYNSYGINAVLPTVTAKVMAAIIESASESRKANQQVRAANTEAIVSEIEGQVEEMKTKAKKQLIWGIVAGGTTILASGISMLYQGKKGLTGADAQNFSTFAGSINSFGQGSSNIFSAIGNYKGTAADAEIKDKDAKIERTKAYNEMIESNTQALNDLIKQALSVLAEVQASERQTMQKIMA